MNGFRQGFNIHYEGPSARQHRSSNIPIRVGSPHDMWEKLMKEVDMGRIAGPFEEIPMSYFVQSPIGLVPKANNKTRLIFQLSYNFDGPDGGSVNSNIPDSYCTVKYKDLDYAVASCLDLAKQLGYLEQVMLGHESANLHFAKTDILSAFRILPVLPQQRFLLIMQARHPIMQKLYVFVDKNLPFGCGASCALFQSFSDGLLHIMEFMYGQKFRVTNYLDDFLFVAESEDECNRMVRIFLAMCSDIGCPISMDKTHWAATILEFLGIVLHGEHMMLMVPNEKRIKALNLLRWTTANRKITIKIVQRLTGILNFLNKAIVPGRTFTRNMYYKLKIRDKQGTMLRSYHHVKVDSDFKSDAEIWIKFLDIAATDVRQLCRPFVDFSQLTHADLLDFYTDSSLNPDFGMGVVFGDRWCYLKWGREFILQEKPSIEFLELFALVAGVITWGSMLRNCRIEIFCDNESVIGMIHKLTSPCPKCMKLIRILVLDNLLNNRKVFVRHIRSRLNILADSLSRLDFKRFWRNAPASMNKQPDSVHESLVPACNIWYA